MDFSKFVLDTLKLHERYSRNSKIQLSRLSMLPFPNFELHVLERSLILRRKMDVKELHRVCAGVLRRQFLISQSITVLNLNRCKIESSYPIKMPTLKTLDLYMVDVSDGGLEKLLSNCPSIENLSLNNMSIILCLNISCRKLKYLTLRSMIFSRRASIEAPNLEKNYLWMVNPDLQLEIASSTRLRLLILSTIDCLCDDMLENLIRQNPHLEKLELGTCFGLHRTCIQSQSLRHLILDYCKSIVELNIDAPQMQTLGLFSSLELLDMSINAPNLGRFTYEGNLMSLSKLNTSHLFESEINFCCLKSYGRWYNKLKQLLEKFEQCRGLTLKSLEDKQLAVPREIRENLPLRLYGVENLKVKILKSTMNYLEPLDGLYWCFLCLKTLEIEISNPVGSITNIGRQPVMLVLSIWRYMGFV